MTYAIIGLGKIGSAIAQAFARKGIEVTVAGRRAPEALAPLAAQIGPSLVPRSIQEAVKADVVILAVPFATHREVARAAANWKGKIVIDAMNAFNVPPEDLGGLPSTAAVAKALPGAMLVKAFNHLAAASLARGPTTLQGGRRVVFVSSDDDAASASVAGLVDRLGFAPVELGKLGEGGLLVQARGSTWGRLIFQDLAKFD
jgi:8-hydroxy-5-deazaflavin:NADPH oxidoreductase